MVELEKLQAHLITSVNSFVQIGAAMACHPPKDEVIELWKEWESKVLYCTKYINNEIDLLSCKQAEGGFYAWVNISAARLSSMEFTQQLLRTQNVAVVHGSSFGESGEGYIRFTCVKSWEELKEGLKRLKRFVECLRTV